MRYKGTVKGGVVVLEDNVHLPDGATVEVDLPEGVGDDVSDESVPSLFERLKPVVGKAKGLPPDASKNIDRDLYGRAKP